MINNFIGSLTRRIPGVLSGLNKYYHQWSSISNMRNPLTASIESERNIRSLVQRTVIPLNIVKPKPAILEFPRINITIGKLDYSLPEKIDLEPEKEIIDPNRNEEKKAHRMLIIKRSQMNRHKYKKRQRKMKFHYARIKRERRFAKEVQFRQEIATKLKEIQKFDAEAYVAEKLEMYRKKLLPDRLHGKCMPAFVVEEWLAKRERRKQLLAEKLERRRKLIKERGSLNVDVKS